MTYKTSQENLVGDYFITRDKFNDIYSYGRLWLWGSNQFGQLGDNTQIYRSSPIQTISGGNNWVKISTGSSHSAAIKTDGTLWLWGENHFGRLGNNNTLHQSSPVQTIGGGNNWSKIAAGAVHSMAIKTDGTLWVWGGNNYGQLATNDILIRSSPTQTISGGNDWDKIATYGTTSMAIKTDGTLWGWGYNFNGQLGDNTQTDRSSPIQTVSGGNNWDKISVGYYHSMAIKTDGTLWLWGDNFHGQLGDNSIIHRSSPVQTISGGNNWTEIAAGHYNSMAIKTDNTLWLWGENIYGKLGDNTDINRSSPVQTISGGNNWSKISAGYYHSAAIKTDGTLWLWGRNIYGKLGDNTEINRSSPIQTISGGNNWTEIAAGYFHSMAIFLP